MARDGAGNYSLPSGNPVVPNTVISSGGWANPTLSDIAAAITQSLSKDGQTVPTANLPMGNYRHINVASAVNRTDYAAAGQVQDGGMQWLTTISGTDTITAALAVPPLAAYAAGQTFRFIAAGANTGNAVTLNINSLGAKAVMRPGAAGQLAVGDIAPGTVATVTYDGTQFQLMGVSGVVGHGQCRLSVVSTTQITLAPFGGNNLIINGVPQQIPAAGVTYTLSGLAASTVYYVYAFMNAGVMTLEAVTTTHATSGNGVEIKSGDATRTLVGMVRTNVSTQFVNTAAQRFCLNWFNRQPIAALNQFAAQRLTTSTTMTEVSSIERCEFLFWANSPVFGAISGTSGLNTTGLINSSLNLPSGSALSNAYSITVSGTFANISIVTPVFIAGEGYSYFTLFGNTVSGFTSSWSGGLTISAQISG